MDGGSADSVVNCIKCAAEREHVIEIGSGAGLETDDADKATGCIEECTAALSVLEVCGDLQHAGPVERVYSLDFAMAHSELSAPRVACRDDRVAQTQVFCRTDCGRRGSGEFRNGWILYTVARMASAGHASNIGSARKSRCSRCTITGPSVTCEFAGCTVLNISRTKIASARSPSADQFLLQHIRAAVRAMAKAHVGMSNTGH